ncbi:COPII-coated vesicle protein [Pisolithus albus]|nr:COPII-coated vesicle protein [Pisolithus albus]
MTLLCILLLPILSTLVSAHKISVEASTKECFFEDLHQHDQMTITYQVGEGGHLDIDFWPEKDGRYEYCFSNQMSTMADKQVSFNVHGIIYIPEEADIVAPVEREIRSLAIGLLAVKDEQEYIVVRERRHRDTAESTNDRVKWWSVLQAVVLFSVVAWQVYYLKSFFEVKRII